MTDVDRFRANSSANFSMFEGLSKGFFIFYFATRGLEEDEVQSWWKIVILNLKAFWGERIFQNCRKHSIQNSWRKMYNFSMYNFDRNVCFSRREYIKIACFVLCFAKFFDISCENCSPVEQRPRNKLIAQTNPPWQITYPSLISARYRLILRHEHR